MTITQRKRAQLPDEIQGLQIHCDSCTRDLTHSIRIKCADPVCEAGDGIDICPSCFCSGKEFKSHKRGHAYRVVELHSYPIFVEDWGADEELLLIEGIALQGLGNWQEIAKHVGTRTKEEVEDHYNNVYINSPNWPLPRMDVSFDVDPSLFHERKRRRISSMTAAAANSKPVQPPTSAPGVHDIATFLPGRLEFEHELDNEAEDLVKDLEFGVILEYGGDKIPIDEEDVDVVARAKLEEERRRIKEKKASALANAGILGSGSVSMIGPDGRELSTDSTDVMTSLMSGYDIANGNAEVRREKMVKEEEQAKARGQKIGREKNSTKDKEKEKEGEADTDEPVLPPPYETRDSINFKLSLLEMYNHRVEKRLENKAVMFDRGLTEYKKMQVNEKKRPKEERDIVQRLKPLAKLQTASDYDAFVDGILLETVLRKRIQELQHYRRMGLRTPADIERYELDLQKRAQAKATLATTSHNHLNLRIGSSRGSVGPDPRRHGSTSTFPDADGIKDGEATVRANAPGSGSTSNVVRRNPAPLNLMNAASLHLLTPAEQIFCSQIRILPKPYLVIKETLVREYARRGGKLRRREARDLARIDVNKMSRIWDFLVQAGYLRIQPPDESMDAGDAPSNVETPASTVNGATPTLLPSTVTNSRTSYQMFNSSHSSPFPGKDVPTPSFLQPLQSSQPVPSWPG
ncbi:transcriptional adapter 2 [Pyrrhoderma noxium]|uniref:Transcriptional adapter 2 n=1 Tax=Pyrrhoderma noxium TaxID=2282107 RepID=A0A286UFY2_9AGAM|nr:transcriptional adapter 2 [Pyrrhoderma noxium]